MAGNVGVVIARWISPAFKLGQHVSELEEHDKKDYKAIENLIGANKLVCEALIVLLDHERAGNGNDNIRAVKKKMNDYLISK